MDDAKLTEMLDAMGGVGAAGQDLIKVLGAMSKAGAEDATATKAVTDQLQKLKDRASKLDAGLAGLATTGISIIAAFGSVTTAAYGAKGAFTAVIPTVNAFSAGIKGVVTALGQMFSGVTVAGFGFGEATKGAATLLTTGIELLTNVIRFQLETAQKLADNYVDMAKSGATFGGSINRMAAAASDAELPIADFAQLIKTNVEALVTMGGSLTQNAVQVSKMSVNIGKTNAALLVQYGSYEALAQGVTEYIALQNRLGIDESRRGKGLTEAATEYLFRQKELTALTGKNAETLKKEEEARSRELAYKLKISRMDDNARRNLDEGIGVATKFLTDEGMAYIKELVATGGRVVSASAITYQNMNQEGAALAQNIYDTRNQSKQDYRKGLGEYLQASAPAMEAFAKQTESLAEINYAANNTIIKGMTDQGAKFVEAVSMARNAVEMFAKLEKERLEGPGAASAGFAAAIEMNRTTQIQIDGIVRENMNKMSELVKFFYDQQKKMIGNQQLVSDALNALANKDMKAFKEAVKGIVTSILGIKDEIDANLTPQSMKDANTKAEAAGAAAEAAKLETDVKKKAVLIKEAKRLEEEAMAAYRKADQDWYAQRAQRLKTRREEGRAAAQEQNRPLPPPETSGRPVTGKIRGADAPVVPAADNKALIDDLIAKGKADGGITNGPSLAGEAGPEAVIPLKNGSIPLDINLGEMISALREQTDISRDLLDAMRDSKDIQQKILYATA